MSTWAEVVGDGTERDQETLHMLRRLGTVGVSVRAYALAGASFQHGYSTPEGADARRAAEPVEALAGSWQACA